jgi:hypothetical protein
MTTMKTIGLGLLLALASACGGKGSSGNGTGNAQIFVVPEDTITNGLDPGADLDAIQDGWTVRYTKFLAVIGNVRAASSANAADAVSEPKVYVIDLLHTAESGFLLADFQGIDATRWDKVGYDMPNASSSALAAGAFTSAADVQLMVSKGYSLYFEGSIAKTGGKECTDPKNPTVCVDAPGGKVAFKWGLAVGTSYDDCGTEQGDSGFTVPTGGSTQHKPTIHGDHWFFSNIPHGSSEITKRLAQWIANCDLNHDGETTLDELKMVKAPDVFPAATYNLSGGIVPIATAYDYLVAEAASIGHYDGDGDCATRHLIQKP